ncbi:MAG: hypothetical protein M4579_003672 [Chaenotheca gracillima]|nr:MAG: hypothetical protein M4579_003672 [Chaenotheca gracillima]
MSLATIGILSVGEMGLGVAKLLKASGYRVVTNVGGRSPATKTRAEAANIDLLNSDEDFTAQSDYVLSIVPPRDALGTAQRILDALKPRPAPLYYMDLNAVSPRSAREIAALFEGSSPGVRVLDGGIIGGPPAPKPDTPSGWKCPSVVVSGPYPLKDATPSGAHLATTLNMQHVGPEIGTASGLKMCFASLTKGFIGIATQSFSTAQRLGVLDELRAHLAEYSPALGKQAEQAVVKMPPKAYRWVREMAEIADTHRVDGGWAGDAAGKGTLDEEGRGGKSIFEGVEEVYRVVADETVLGDETTENRVRGKTAEDVAVCVSEGLKNKEASRG